MSASNRNHQFKTSMSVKKLPRELLILQQIQSLKQQVEQPRYPEFTPIEGKKVVRSKIHTSFNSNVVKSRQKNRELSMDSLHNRSILQQTAVDTPYELNSSIQNTSQILNIERSFFEAESTKAPFKINSSSKIKQENLYGLQRDTIPMDTIWSVNRNFTDTKIEHT